MAKPTGGAVSVAQSESRTCLWRIVDFGRKRFRARNVHLDRPSAGHAGEACQAGRSSGSGGRITRGQTPVAHHEALAATCHESDFNGSADAGSLRAFRVTRTLEQDGRDTEAFHSSEISPRPGEAQVLSSLQLEKASSPWTQRSLKRSD